MTASPLVAIADRCSKDSKAVEQTPARAIAHLLAILLPLMPGNRCQQILDELAVLLRNVLDTHVGPREAASMALLLEAPPGTRHPERSAWRRQALATDARQPAEQCTQAWGCPSAPCP
jgi:hypothetical protein